MRNWKLASGVLAIVAYPSSAEADLEPPGAALVLTISTLRTTYLLDEEVGIDVDLRNVSDHTVSLPNLMRPPWHWLRFVVEDALGKALRYSGDMYNADWKE